MALMHYQFEAIHPFSDGNSRTRNPKTVGNYLQTLEEQGFLKSVKVGKEKLYLNQRFLTILEGKQV
jgi:Fic family protein